MLKTVITVPKDKCPLNVLAEMGADTRNAWIFLHQNAIEKLRSTAEEIVSCSSFLSLGWKATDQYPATSIMVERSSRKWNRVFIIKADDITFDPDLRRPKRWLCLKMAE